MANTTDREKDRFLRQQSQFNKIFRSQIYIPWDDSFLDNFCQLFVFCILHFPICLNSTNIKQSKSLEDGYPLSKTQHSFNKLSLKNKIKVNSLTSTTKGASQSQKKITFFDRQIKRLRNQPIRFFVLVSVYLER